MHIFGLIVSYSLRNLTVSDPNTQYNKKRREYIHLMKPVAFTISLTTFSRPVVVLAGFGNLPGDMVYFYTKQFFSIILHPENL